MHNPVSTYRIQFHKEFTFEDLKKVLPYLQKLGISSLYASPIFKATPDSMHGYDGVDPHQINPEIGNEEGLVDLHENLEQMEIGWVQDIVPNHMAFHPTNLWLMDLLEKGSRSNYASFFDTSEASDFLKGKIMVPFLGAPLKKVIENKEIKIALKEKQLVCTYYDAVYPSTIKTYSRVLSGIKSNDSINKLTEQIASVSSVETPEIFSNQYDEIKLQFAALSKDKTTLRLIEEALERANNSSDTLLQILEEQHYRLCYWQETDQKINYRRFFTVNGLICLNIQDKKVFEEYHTYIAQLVKKGIFKGLRIDHIDGLYDPSAYLNDLRAITGPETYIVVEKILEQGEKLPERWPIQGETGYNFLAIANNLFTNRESREKFTTFYQQMVGNSNSVHQQILVKKANILHEHMAGELDNLYNYFLSLNLVDEDLLQEINKEKLKDAIAAVLIACPVYRYYGNQLPLAKSEAQALENIFREAIRSNKDLEASMAVIEKALLKKPLEEDKDFNSRALRFYQRLMQFSGPLMAKGVEDTLMYTHTNYIGHNEVGDSPESFGISIPEYHQLMLDRQKNWPLAINTTSTHDTKRGEDVRMRLNVLSALADEWFSLVKAWRNQNTGIKENNTPEASDEYLIYQTLLGAYPMPDEDEDNFKERLQEYLQKALREAKANSNWTSPNEAYESATKKFAVALLDQEKPFWKSFKHFHQKVADFGIVNSLAQVILKFTSPGVPDVYQGTEMWDLSLVDPDNRRPVDYVKRAAWAEQLEEIEQSNPSALWDLLWKERYNGKIKLWLTKSLFSIRKSHPELFEKGEYIPLEVTGKYKDKVIAFARKHKEKLMLVALPLSVASLCKAQNCDIASIDWEDTKVKLPEDATNWQDLLQESSGSCKGDIDVQQLFSKIPYSLLLFKENTERGAGVLLHISSLPSPFGIGDLGPEARGFADFLQRSKQKYWQLLPLNPTEKAQHHSPYSSISSMAGNPLLISPELLSKDGLITRDELTELYLPQDGKADYERASEVKSKIFDKAWKNFIEDDFQNLTEQFETFCSREAAWLDDFALYMAIKEKQGGKPWYEWHDPLKLKQEPAISDIYKEESNFINKTKWLQFIFFKQWKQLRSYCNKKGIQLFGDIPIYISYDSVDVWSHRDIFMLDEKGKMTGVAGVPPDYFNEDGQLWGMPVFRWDILKQQNYAWWMQRLKVNMALYDLIRLDHFRAFADYWEVPAAEETAKNGAWKKGPGADFFNTARETLGDLPFVAEDLGEINDVVLELRDAFAFPGMKVLQFAFGEEMPNSPYIPHNYTNNFIAYTGTHDNNTVLGWYRTEGKAHHKQLEQYMGRELQENEIYWALGKLAFASVAKIAIIPIQDLLNLDESARMNLPGAVENNWLWRLRPGQITKENEKMLKGWTVLYNR